MSYLKYVNIASAMVRKVLKEPFKAKSKGLDDALFTSVKIDAATGKAAEKGTRETSVRK